MWTSHTYTNTGKVRQINEDALLDLADQKLWLVADGMGGHSFGDYASNLVVSSFSEYLASPMTGTNKLKIRSTLEHCNDHLIKRADEQRVDIIGSTVAILSAQRNNITCCWSGDSRIYRLRNKELLMLTVDHSQEQSISDRDRIRQPESIQQGSGMLTGAIGGDHQLALEHCWYGLQSGDRFLLCTDGLNKEVSDIEIEETMNRENNDEAVVSVLSELYLARGAHDNIGFLVLTHG